MPEALQQRLAFLLVDQFSLMSYAAVIEPFRAANALAGRELYVWQHVSLGGKQVSASSGITFMPDSGLDAALPADTLFVFAAGALRPAVKRPFASWLRKLGRSGTVVAGVSAGPYIIADAGLLDGYRATIHWDHREDFEERYPAIVHEEALFVIDRNRITCAGGMAGMDLAIELIRRDHGHDLAARLSDWFIRPDPRTPDRPQRAGVGTRYGVKDSRLLQALAVMEDRMEFPASRAELAQSAGLSVRQLERVFSTELGTTIAGQYRAIRLEKAAHLLRTTTRPATDIALSCGFASNSHFARSFRQAYRTTPGRYRGLLA
ncbi:GlxA family transcriptional regulator [Novosphingobium sp.]|uniref:GlxA family transcriptional regulator n=1 Tax=Novosphingobium sp. TaxID=1874826 RepID=UPI002614EAAD|nr:GlxA family transcriptional regulator [Novosphingobium sp.]